MLYTLMLFGQGYIQSYTESWLLQTTFSHNPASLFFVLVGRLRHRLAGRPSIPRIVRCAFESDSGHDLQQTYVKESL